MKKFNLFLAAAAIFGMSASAQDYSVEFYTPEAEITVEPGTNFVLPIYIKADAKVRDFQLDLVAPEGVEVVKNKGKYQVKYNEDVCDTELYNVTGAYKATGHRFLMLGFILMDTKEEILEYCIQPTEGDLLANVTLSAPAAEGDYVISIDEAMATLGVDDAEGNALACKSPTQTITLKVKDPSGIENVVVAGEANDGAYYDLMGRRVVNPVAGIYVHNGKKVLVK